MRVVHTTKTLALTPVAIVARGTRRVTNYVKHVHAVVEQDVTEKERTRQQINAEKALAKMVEQQKQITKV